MGVLVSLGGDIAVAGRPPAAGRSGSPRTTRPPRRPGPGRRDHRSGLATSGTTVRRWRTDQGEAHHVLDPATGRPAATPWRTVSVAAATCLDANIAATAAIVLGDAAPDWLEARRLPARLVGAGGEVERRRRLARRPGGSVIAAAGNAKTFWYLTRGTGIVALLLLTASVVLGVLTTARWRTAAVASLRLAAVHRNLTLLALASSSSTSSRRCRRLRADRPQGRGRPVRLPYRPVWLGLGAVAFDLLLALVVTSLLRARFGYRLWRRALARVRLVAGCADPRARHRQRRARGFMLSAGLASLASSRLAVLGASLSPRAGECPCARRRRAALVVPLAIVRWYQAGRRSTAGRRAGTPPSLLARRVTQRPGGPRRKRSRATVLGVAHRPDQRVDRRERPRRRRDHGQLNRGGSAPSDIDLRGAAVQGGCR